MKTRTVLMLTLAVALAAIMPSCVMPIDGYGYSDGYYDSSPGYVGRSYYSDSYYSTPYRSYRGYGGYGGYRSGYYGHNHSHYRHSGGHSHSYHRSSGSSSSHRHRSSSSRPSSSSNQRYKHGDHYHTTKTKLQQHQRSISKDRSSSRSSSNRSSSNNKSQGGIHGRLKHNH